MARKALYSNAGLNGWSVVVVLGLLVFMAACQHHFHPVQTSVVVMAAELPAEDQSIDEMIAPYRDSLTSEMDVVIARCDRVLTRSKPEGTLGNWVADAIMTQAERIYGKPIDFAIQNSGGIRIPELPAGDVTIGKMYELMPFDNLVVVMELDGEGVIRMLDHMAEDGGWPVSAELTYKIDGQQAVEASISGESIDPERIYAFALPDYVANGGSDTDFLADIAISRTDLDLLVRDALIAEARHIQASGSRIEAREEGRVIRIN